MMEITVFTNLFLGIYNNQKSPFKCHIYIHLLASSGRLKKFLPKILQIEKKLDGI